jgi:hypothetical protein
MLSDSNRKSSNLSDSEIRRLSSILTSSIASSAFPELSQIPSELHLPIIEELELPRNKKPNPYDQLIHQNYQQIIETLEIVQQDRSHLQHKLKSLLFRVDEEIGMTRREIFQHRADKLHYHLLTRFLSKISQENEKLEECIRNPTSDALHKETQTEAQTRSAIPKISIHGEVPFRSSRIPLAPIRSRNMNLDKENSSRLFQALNSSNYMKASSSEAINNISNISDRSDSPTRIPKPSCKF